MAKSSRQKLKLLYILRCLTEKTDEEHVVTVPELIEYLAAEGISAERKSIYDDMEVLRLFGYDIEMHKGKRTGYYMASRLFQRPEIKMLVDIIQSAKFITVKKSNELIKKVESLAAKHEAQQIQGQVHVLGRIKTMNESVYYNIDRIHAAISENRKITFRYFEYNNEKKKVYRHDGRKYILSPLALICDNENYYLIAHDDEKDMVKHYRVDKMENIDTTIHPREGLEHLKTLDLAGYSRKRFSMFDGEEVTVRMRFTNNLAGVVVDRFGRDVMMIKDGEDHFTASADVCASPQFYGWLLSLGTGVQLISPKYMVDELKNYLNNITKQYN